MYYLSILLLITVCLWPVISYAHTSPPLALSKFYQATEDLTHYWVSEKYDGVRAYWDGNKLLTRSGKTIHAPTEWLSQLPDIALDGELWIAHQQFDHVSGLIRQKHPDSSAWQAIQFMVFDLPKYPGTFSERYHQLEALVAASQAPNLRLVKQTSISSHQALDALLSEVTRKGAEGLMLRRIDTLYASGRTNDLLKVKPYMDDEAVVIDHQQGQGKYTNQLGALIVMDKNGREFKIGTGFSDDQRANPPEVGDTISYQYHGRTSTGLPRFASFLRVRSDE